MQKKSTFLQSLFVIATLGIIMFCAIVVYDASPHIPMIFGCAVSAIMALRAGYSWQEIQDAMIDGIHQALESLIILMMIGVLVAIWIQSGAVPTMICYGLQLLSPRFYLVTTMVICSVISMAVGSWGTAGTVGLAFMGIAAALEIPLPLAAGAIISGCYVGDKLSPLSDSTNLSSAVTGVNIFENVRQMFPVAGIAYLIALILYTMIGFRYCSQDTQALTGVTEYILQLHANFWISPINLLPLLLLIVCVVAKIPAIPSIGIGILSATVLSCCTQGSPIGSILVIGFSGYVSHTGNQMMDTLLTAGGIEAMLYSVSIIIVAMMFGGIMEHTKQMEALMRPIMEKIHSIKALVSTTVVSCVLVNLILPEQYIAIALPGRMLFQEYDRHGISRKYLAIALGAGGAATSALVPWNTCGVYMSGVLGVSTFAYIPFAFFNLLMPFMMIAFSWSIRKESPAQQHF